MGGWYRDWIKALSFPTLLATLLVTLVFLNGCDTEVICSTPYILKGGGCCLDEDQNGACDTGGELKDSGSGISKARGVKEISEIGSKLVSEIGERIEEEEGEGGEGVERVLIGGEVKKADSASMVGEDEPYLGAADAKVAIIEYGDYEEFLVKRFHHEILPKILEDYGRYVKFVFRDYPKLGRESSWRDALASECALEQGKFWEYHEKLLENFPYHSEEYLKKYAREIGLNGPDFDRCVLDERHMEKVEQEYKMGRKFSVVVVPTFFVDGEMMEGFVGFEKFKAKLDAVLSEELVERYGVQLIAVSTGKVSMILEGVAALDESITKSPFSNKIDIVDGRLNAVAVERTKNDDVNSVDSGSLDVEFVIFDGRERREVKIKMEKLLKVGMIEGMKYPFFGGVGREVYVYGNSGVGSNLLPRTYGHLFMHGVGDIYVNNELFDRDVVMEFVVVNGIRDSGMVRDIEDKKDIEAYLYVPGKYIGQGLRSAPNGFFYLFWEDLNFKVV